MSSKRPLSGVTLPTEYSLGLRDWTRESRFREERIEAARNEGMTEEEIAQSPNLPQPRGWWEFATDPKGDGAPTSNNSNEPGKLDPTSNLNNDSYLTKNWWEDETPGLNSRDILAYQQMYKSDLYKGDFKSDVADFLSYHFPFGGEAFHPDIYVRTSMADFVPNMFNIFMTGTGDRYDPATEPNFLPRAAKTLGAGVVGYALLGGTVYLGFTRLAPKMVGAGMEIVEKIFGGSVEIAGAVVEEGLKTTSRIRENREAITGD